MIRFAWIVEWIEENNIYIHVKGSLPVKYSSNHTVQDFSLP